MVKAKKWVLVKHFSGVPKDSDLEIQEEELAEVKDGEILLEAQFFSVDPYMRAYAPNLPLGSTMIGQQLAKVTKSKHKTYAEGSLVLATVGWRDRTIINPDKPPPSGSSTPILFPLWNVGDLSPSLALGLIGMPGATSYFGLLRLCDPKPGETVFVNSGAGIVGSTVGQLAKIKGCRVVSCAGSEDKCEWLRKDLGFDYVFNYKTTDLDKALKEGAPKGIDCYFDNVGGKMSCTVIEKYMNKYGRVSICGSISAYNATEVETGPYLFRPILFRELKVQGFIVYTFLSDFPAAFAELLKWIKEGKLKVREHVLTGFENLRPALYGLLNGDFTGKVLVKVEPNPNPVLAL